MQPHPQKGHPFLPINPPLKIKVLSSPFPLAFCKFGRRFNPLQQRKGRGRGCTLQFTYLMVSKYMVPFYGWGSTALSLEPLRGGSLILLTTKLPEIHGTHFINLGRMKGWVNLGTAQWFWIQELWVGNPAP